MTRPGAAWAGAWTLAFAGAALPVVSFFLAPGPVTAKSLVAALLSAAALRPDAAWLAAAALAPLGALAAGWIGASSSLTEPIVLAFLAGWLAHESARALAGPTAGASNGADGVTLGLALLLGVTVLASLAVRLAAHHVTVDFAAPYARGLFRFLWHDYFGGPSRFRAPVAPAFHLLEAVALFAATVVLCRRHPRFVVRGAGALAAGAAIAAAASLAALAANVAAVGWSGAFPRGAVGTRVSSVGRDVNAAGSYYALAFGAAAGLVLADRRYRAIWALAGVLALAGLWMTGSRVGLAAPALVAIGLAAVLGWRRGGRAAVAAAVVAGALVVLAGGYLYSTATVRTRAAVALEWRVEHGATALRMFAAHPLFGAGVGRFYALSREYASPDWGRRDNAHNNFLQVLAELGLLGLGLLVALVGRVLWRAWTAGAASPPGGAARSDPLLACLAGGVAAYVLTWFAGHPLLVLEAAVPFWLALGLVAGMASGSGLAASRQNAEVRDLTPRRHLRSAGALLALVIALSAVPRARAEIRGGDLSSAVMGFSAAHTDARGQRFRWMARRAQVFVPHGTREVAIPLRSPGGPATIRVLVGGEVVARLVVEQAWREALVTLPPVHGRRFVPLELRASVVPAVLPAGGGGEAIDTRVQVGAPRIVR